MYWYKNGYGIYNHENVAVGRAYDDHRAYTIVKEHNEAIRQLTQREVTAKGKSPAAALKNLAIRCDEQYQKFLGNENHLRLGDDGWWYATTVVDMLDSDA